MNYQLNPTFWIKHETDRVEAIITMQQYWTETWTLATLQAAMLSKGLTYNDSQIAAICAELVTRGVLVDVS